MSAIPVRHGGHEGFSLECRFDGGKVLTFNYYVYED